METTLRLDILPQPDETTCGPTCLHALYRYYGIQTDLATLIGEITRLENGGTLGVLLANHALRRGFSATIQTYNVRLFDPTWFSTPGVDLARKLRAQARVKESKRLQASTKGYLEFLKLGGRVAFDDLTDETLFAPLSRGTPILTGLSATYLYRCPREYGDAGDFDDVRGVPQGHFVVLCGCDRRTRKVLVADPLSPNPPFGRHFYELDVDRVKNAILLGIVTYDAVVVTLEPGAELRRAARAAVQANGHAGPAGRRGRSGRGGR